MSNVQNHIHISKTLLGSPEFSPDQKWAVVFPNYTPQPRTIVGLKWGLTGKLAVHRLQSAGATIKFKDYRITIKIAATDTETLSDRIADIQAMNGETVNFIPIMHADDGTDHTADVKVMFLQILSTGKPYTPMIMRYDYEIQLTDANTVT